MERKAGGGQTLLLTSPWNSRGAPSLSPALPFKPAYIASKIYLVIKPLVWTRTKRSGPVIDEAKPKALLAPVRQQSGTKKEPKTGVRNKTQLTNQPSNQKSPQGKKSQEVKNQSRYEGEGIGKLGRFQNKTWGKKHTAFRPFQVSFQHEVRRATSLLLWGCPPQQQEWITHSTKRHQGVKHSSEIYNQLPLSEKSPCPVPHC